MSDAVERILEQWRRERPDLDVSPMAVIGRMTRAMNAAELQLTRNFSRHGLDSGSFDVLATLLRSGSPYSLSPAALADSAMVTSSAIAQRLNKLADRGLVVRSKDPDDKRGTVVTLTPEGKALVERVLPDHLATERSLIKGLGAEEQAKFMEVLGRIEANASEG
ncbi:MarR family winged helix-turn-helix transcriptional regulator [Arthrobacter sp. B2a2-09]|uniref:MarR family winged helix-turn-helix transcriptional regulator n=1 Tax=Arthrobacter sp. B2a2-09 TaxID=2952822 RepID=UPI0022CD8C43|nr:MarR family transcriptional regulator [Arthrobacter sp. B2a2-09]MCZ9880849.1 MarR family transcriptional regulator [Arthrobacter sp. B2a2-09]